MHIEVPEGPDEFGDDEVGAAIGELEGGDIEGSVVDGELEGMVVDGELEGTGKGAPVDKVGELLEGVFEGDALGKMVADTASKSKDTVVAVIE